MQTKSDKVTTNAIFLNIPYDNGFRSLYLAYIVGLVYLGFEPHAILEIPDAMERLNKIFAKIQGCRYSIHDLSRVGLDRNPPFITPRFNMPFELGLTVMWAKLNPKKHSWFVFETKKFRMQKSLSDLNGWDPRIHEGQIKGVMRELSNLFRRRRKRPNVPKMMKAYKFVSHRLAKIIENAGAESLFESRAFQDLCYAAKFAAEMPRQLK